MAMTEGWRSVEWEDRVRLRIPPDWIALAERAEGHDVAVFRPAADGAGVLRLVADERAPRPGETAAAVLHEMALRFVRPDDARVSDRAVETRADGATLARAVLVAAGGEGGAAGEGGDGAPESHYLWLLGAVRGERVRVAMFSLALPAEHDGREPWVTVLAALDEAIGAAGLL